MQFFKNTSLARFYSSKNKQSRVSQAKVSKDYQALESRRVLAAIFLDTTTGDLFISGNDGNDVGSLVASGNQVEASIAGAPSQTFNASAVSNVFFIGGAGNDTLSNDTNIPGFFFAGAGNDTVTGGSNVDFIIGDGGSDVIDGGDGDDTLIGGFGDDTIFGGEGDDSIFGSADVNTLHGENGDDLIFGGDQVDTIFGGNGIDQIYGLAGNDILSAGDGGIAGTPGIDNADLILGLDGDDIITGGNGLNVLWGGNGNDTITGGNSAENRLHGQGGNDILTGGDRFDFIRGLEGDNTIDGRAGNDLIIAGVGDEDFDGGAGNDTVRFTGNYNNFRINENNPNVLTVRDLRNIQPQGDNDTQSVETFQFADQTRAAAISSVEQLVVRPIVVSNNNGSNTATFFGNDETRLEIENLIDDIFAQANVDVVWEPVVSHRDTFANNGTLVNRPGTDLNRIVDEGDADGVGSSNSNVIDAYFVQRAPGFGNVGDDFANGFAFINSSGAAIHVGDNLLDFQGGLEVIAAVVAHELGHNLGLGHVDAPSNLLNSGVNPSNGNNFLAPGQVDTILNSPFTGPIGQANFATASRDAENAGAGLIASVADDGSINIQEFHDHGDGILVQGHDHNHGDECTCPACC